jgi:protein-S-isoprenylcysteine O-methyltransferase Ste14
MGGELPFQIAVVGLMVGMKVVRLTSYRYAGWKAGLPALRRNPRDVVFLTLMALAWLTGYIAYFAFPTRIGAFGLGLPVWLRWVGVGLAAASLALLAWADHSLGPNLSVTLDLQAEHKLVTTGPYRWVRHPIYTSSLLFTASHVLITSNAFVGACLLGGVVILCLGRIPREERMMLARFGDAYRAHMARTGRFLPPLLRR